MEEHENSNNEEEVLKVIQPLESETNGIIALQRLDALLRKPATARALKKACLNPKQNGSVCSIQSKRYEVFIQATGKSSTYFDSLCRKLFNASPKYWRSLGITDATLIKSAILDYANTVAREDPRTAVLVLGTFSLIVSYGAVKAQDCHIDLMIPNHQYGLIVTGNSPGTNVYTVVESPVQTASDLQTAYPGVFSDAVVDAIAGNEGAAAVLEHYGNVLCPNLKETSSGSSLSTGTLISIPGSVVHAGPESTKYRTILFFSGWPPGSTDVPEYNPDTQYSAGLVLCDLIIPIWPHLAPTDRRAMLTHLMNTIQIQAYPKGLADLIVEGKMQDFCRSVANAKTDSRRLQIIERTIQFPVLMGDKNLDLASVPDLWLADNKGKHVRVEILRLVDSPVEGAVCVQYVDTPWTWEGTTAGKPFRLTMHADDGQLFNGENGTLRCDDGVPIPCFLKDQRRRPASSRRPPASHPRQRPASSRRPPAAAASRKPPAAAASRKPPASRKRKPPPSADSS